jgi:hypothetical protein
MAGGYDAFGSHGREDSAGRAVRILMGDQCQAFPHLFAVLISVKCTMGHGLSSTPSKRSILFVFWAFGICFAEGTAVG